MQKELPKPSVQIILLPGTEDPPLTDVNYQAELHSFKHSLKKAGIETEARSAIRDVRPGAIYAMTQTLLGEFALPLAQAGVTAVSAAVVAWIMARGNRRVRIKIGDIEVEARTQEQAEEMLRKLLEIRREADEARKDT